MLNFYLWQWGQAHRLTPTFIIEPIFLYKENHALDAWFNKAYGDEQIAI